MTDMNMNETLNIDDRFNKPTRRNWLARFNIKMKF